MRAALLLAAFAAACAQTEVRAPSMDDARSLAAAETAFAVNERTENIGARRLYTVLEKLLEEVSFDAGKRGPATVQVDAAYVDARLAELSKNEDLARFVL